MLKIHISICSSCSCPLFALLPLSFVVLHVFLWAYARVLCFLSLYHMRLGQINILCGCQDLNCTEFTPGDGADFLRFLCRSFSALIIIIIIKVQIYFRSKYNSAYAPEYAKKESKAFPSIGFRCME